MCTCAKARLKRHQDLDRQKRIMSHTIWHPVGSPGMRSSEEAHQEVLQKAPPVLGPEVDAPSKMGGLLQECGLPAREHACIHYHLAPLQAPHLRQLAQIGTQHTWPCIIAMDETLSTFCFVMAIEACSTHWEADLFMHPGHRCPACP